MDQVVCMIQAIFLSVALDGLIHITDTDLQCSQQVLLRIGHMAHSKALVGPFPVGFSMAAQSH